MLSLSGRSIPKSGFDAKLVMRLDETTEIMAKDFTKHFVELSHWQLGADKAAKLALDHAKGCLDIRPLVIVLHKGFTVQAVVMKHLIPDFTLALICRAFFEVYVRYRALVINKPHVRIA